jgi:hypothetical protein
MTQMAIARWQEQAGIKRARGEVAGALEAISQAAFKIIKIVELERSGIRDGDGCWHGSDVMGGLMIDIVSAHQRWMDAEAQERVPLTPKERAVDALFEP